MVSQMNISTSKPPTNPLDCQDPNLTNQPEISEEANLTLHKSRHCKNVINILTYNIYIFNFQQSHYRQVPLPSLLALTTDEFFLLLCFTTQKVFIQANKTCSKYTYIYTRIYMYTWGTLRFPNTETCELSRPWELPATLRSWTPTRTSRSLPEKVKTHELKFHQ